jgi:hypothetical protein
MFEKRLYFDPESVVRAASLIQIGCTAIIR